MSEFLNFGFGHAGLVLLEVGDACGPGIRGGHPGPAVAEARERDGRIIGRRARVVRAVLSEVQGAASWPDAVEVEFAGKISADSNPIIARAGGKADSGSRCDCGGRASDVGGFGDSRLRAGDS